MDLKIDLPATRCAAPVRRGDSLTPLFGAGSPLPVLCWLWRNALEPIAPPKQSRRNRNTRSASIRQSPALEGDSRLQVLHPSLDFFGELFNLLRFLHFRKR